MSDLKQVATKSDGQTLKKLLYFNTLFLMSHNCIITVFSLSILFVKKLILKAVKQRHSTYFVPKTIAETVFVYQNSRWKCFSCTKLRALDFSYLTKNNLKLN